ncbi:glycosyltransferase family 4 protein [Bacillus sp. CGMCC 1.16607]|uniref:glycosyltransferase family 4 protein n=1 Tax=Bacillus sp. CGMCC 1.16607 TaxID=3351842 RepID=UPI00362C9C4A
MNVLNQKKLRILLLTWEFPPHIVGGLARHTEGLSFHLQQIGVEVTVITSKALEINLDYENMTGIHIHRVEPLNRMDDQFLNWIGGFNLAMIQKALDLNDIHKYDIIHAHDWLVGEAAICLAKLMHIPLITTIHATEYGRNEGIYTELQQFIHHKEFILIHASIHIIVCSEFMKNEVGEIFACSNEKISVIPNGIEMEEEIKENSQLLHPLLKNESRSIIFTIGRLVREKGFDLIIEAAAKMKGKDLCFVIAGVGPMHHVYEQLIKHYELEKNVYLIGFISDEQRDLFFKHCKAAVFPSRYEPFGIVALEAMKATCPIIVSNTGGLRRLIKPFETGFIMKMNDVDSLVEQINYILNKPETAKKFARNGKKLVSHLYNWRQIAKFTKQLYEEIHLLSSNKKEIHNLNTK